MLKSSLKNIDAVIHLAAISDDPSVELDPQISKEINLNASISLLEFSKKAGIKRFINASSSTVFGAKKEIRVHEGLTLEPISIYGQLKAKLDPNGILPAL